jgi:hypothetical protein
LAERKGKRPKLHKKKPEADLHRAFPFQHYSTWILFYFVNFGTCQQKQKSRATDSKNVCEKNVPKSPDLEERSSEIAVFRQWLPKLPDLEERNSEIAMFRQ